MAKRICCGLETLVIGMIITDWARVVDQIMMILMTLVIMLNTGAVCVREEEERELRDSLSNIRPPTPLVSTSTTRDIDHVMYAALHGSTRFDVHFWHNFRLEPLLI